MQNEFSSKQPNKSDWFQNPITENTSETSMQVPPPGIPGWGQSHGKSVTSVNSYMKQQDGYSRDDSVGGTPHNQGRDFLHMVKQVQQ